MDAREPVRKRKVIKLGYASGLGGVDGSDVIDISQEERIVEMQEPFLGPSEGQEA